MKTTEELNPIDERNPVSVPMRKVRLDEDVFLRYAIETILPHLSGAQYRGTFAAEVLVDEKGNVANINVLQSPDIFRDETVAALKKWKFTPFKTDDGTISFMESTITLSVPIFKARPHEYHFRLNAIEKIMPTYPDKSKENKTSGIVVTEVTTNQHGNVIQLNVLQSPDEYIKEATIAALKQWKFMPFIIEGKEYFLEGKITFLYRLDNGNAEVILAPLFGE
jgi:TonB family protein